MDKNYRLNGQEPFHENRKSDINLGKNMQKAIFHSVLKQILGRLIKN